MLKPIKKTASNIIDFVKDSPIFSYWRTILFVGLTILLLIFIILKFNFSAFWTSLKSLKWYALVLLLLLSVFQQYISWFRYKLFMNKPKHEQVFDYVSVVTVSEVIPPRPLGIYYRFLLSMQLFKSKVKETAFLVAIDTFFEALLISIFALISLFIFPKANLGLQFILYLFGVIGVLYIVFSYYETRLYVVRNKFIKKLIEYFSQLKKKILDSFYKFLGQNIKSLFIGLIATIIKYLVMVLKVYLLFLFFGLDVNFFLCFGLWSIAYFASTSTGLPGGLGAFELSFVYLAKSVNIPESIALNVAILERVFYIWIWVIFTGIYMLFKKTKILSLHSMFVEKLSDFATNINSDSESTAKQLYSGISKTARKIHKRSKLFIKKVSDDLSKN